MYRGTTPTITINCDIDVSEFVTMWVTFRTQQLATYAPPKQVEVTKHLGDEGVDATDKVVTVSLTQADTLLLGSLSPDEDQQVEVQIRGRTEDGRAFASNIMTAPLSRILKDGVITEVHAKVGEEFLKKAITLDEGASRFGEVALVPYDSPISNSGVLFYNTLFDENASCHFAFGDSYACIKDGDKMTKEELKAHGLNDSMTHVDFMVGSKDLSIVGTTHDGKEIKVFENGNFVI